MSNSLIRFIGLEIDIEINPDLPNPSFSLKYGEIENGNKVLSVYSADVMNEKEYKLCSELINSLITLLKTGRNEL